MRHLALETRDALAPLAGRVVRCRGLAMQGGRHNGTRRTLVWRLEVEGDGGGWVRAAQHVWAWGDDLALAFGAGCPVEFDALVRPYHTTDPRTGVAVQRYGLGRVRNAVPLGGLDGDPAREAAAVLVEAYGWDRVADAVADLHGG